MIDHKIQSLIGCTVPNERLNRQNKTKTKQKNSKKNKSDNESKWRKPDDGLICMSCVERKLRSQTKEIELFLTFNYFACLNLNFPFTPSPLALYSTALKLVSYSLLN